jgi:antitoxin YefM
MLSMKLDQDVRPLSEFRARVADFVLKVTQTGRPLLITQRGRGVVVLIDVREFSAMQQRLEFLESLLAANQREGACDAPNVGG